MKIVYLGSFLHPWTSETHITRDAERIPGVEIVRVQEPHAATRGFLKVIEATARDADLLIYQRTWGLHPDATGLWRTLEKRGCKTASFHLDLYVGLERQRTIDRDPFWTTGVCFTADGDPHTQEVLTAKGIDHRWMPAACVSDECVPGEHIDGLPEIVFVGSAPDTYHREWTWRGELLAALTRRYGSKFRRLPVDNVRVHGTALNNLYASVPVIVGDSLALPGHVNYWCVDAETEILTRRGWLHHDEITTADEAYTINPDSRLGEWQDIARINCFPGRHKMLSLESQRHSSLTTLNHRWFVERQTTRGHRGRRWPVKVPTFTTSADLQMHDRIPLGAPCASLPQEPKWSDAFVELVAWAWTEGGWNGDRYTSISQSHHVNAPYVARIRAALTSLVGDARSSLRGVRVPAWRESTGRLTCFALSQPLGDLLASIAPRHHVDAAWIGSLTASQLRLFVETSVDGDGCRKRSGGYTSVTLAQKERRRLDPIEYACALLGIPTSCTRQGDVWLLHLKRRAFTTPMRTGTRRIIEHEGTVWCPTTANRTWLARRDGRVFFTGNSDRFYETVGRGGYLIGPNVPGIEQHFTSGEHLDLYDIGDLDHVYELVDQALADPESTRAIAKTGQAHVRANHTYRHRVEAILASLDLTP